MNTILLNLFTFFLGLLLGNWLAIGRDRRKEFNDAAKPLRSWFLSELEGPSLYSKLPTRVEIDTFTSCLPFWKRENFTKIYQKQMDLREDTAIQDTYGEASFKDEEPIKESISECLSFTKRR